MAELYYVESTTITYHLQKIYKNEELQHETLTQIVRREGNRDVSHNLDFYNLDAIIAVGYRVNSFQMTKLKI